MKKVDLHGPMFYCPFVYKKDQDPWIERVYSSSLCFYIFHFFKWTLAALATCMFSCRKRRGTHFYVREPKIYSFVISRVGRVKIGTFGKHTTKPLTLFTVTKVSCKI